MFRHIVRGIIERLPKYVTTDCELKLEHLKFPLFLVMSRRKVTEILFRKELHVSPPESFRYTNRKMSFSSKDSSANDDTAYQTEYYYKQDKELLKTLKKKTQDEVKSLQSEIKAMHSKIEQYNRDINENLRFLKDLESTTASSVPSNKKA